MCGLKLAVLRKDAEEVESHPVWVCGLKLYGCEESTICQQSHPVWVCGLKHVPLSAFIVDADVTPCMGVWIETWRDYKCLVQHYSHTLYGCVD